MGEISKWNIIIVGESGVGKTSMTIRYVKNSFSEAFNATVIIDFLCKDVKVDGKDVKLHIWDSAGQERWKSIVPQYFKKADGCILVYDITNITSFHKLSGWLSEFRLYNEKAPVIIIGNKSEDPNCKTVGRSVIKTYADQEGMDFMECSAKTGYKVDEVFELLIEKIRKSQMLEQETSFREIISSNSVDDISRTPNYSETMSFTHMEEEPQSFVVTELPPEPVAGTNVQKKKKSCC